MELVVLRPLYQEVPFIDICELRVTSGPQASWIFLGMYLFILSCLNTYFTIFNSSKMKRYWAAYFPADDTFARIDSKKSAGNIKRLGLREIQVSFCGQWFDGTIVGDFDSAAACEKFLSQPIYDSEGIT